MTSHSGWEHIDSWCAPGAPQRAITSEGLGVGRQEDGWAGSPLSMEGHQGGVYDLGLLCGPQFLHL